MRFKHLLFAILACFVATMAAMADETGNLTGAQYATLAASRNLEGIRALLEKERCGASDSLETVFAGIADDLRIINRYHSPEDVHKAALEMLLQDDYMLQCPSNGILNSVAYFNVKKDVLLSGFNYSDFYEFPKNKKALTDFLAEVKDRKIEGYRQQGTNLPGLQICLKAGVAFRSQLTNETLRAEYDEAVRINREKLQMNELQLLLDRIDRIFSYFL